MFSSRGDTISTQLSIERTKTILNGIISSEDYEPRLDKIDLSLLRRSKPAKLTGLNSDEVKIDTKFEDMAILISVKTGLESKKLSVLEFYRAYEYSTKNHGK